MGSSRYHLKRSNSTHVSRSNNHHDHPDPRRKESTNTASRVVEQAIYATPIEELHTVEDDDDELQQQCDNVRQYY